MKDKEIIFINHLGVSEKYAPRPAKEFIPEWYKKMESYIPAGKNPENTTTIKKCMPVFDILNAGYIITTFCDVYVSFKDGEPQYRPYIPEAVTFHPVKQGHLHPNMNEYPFPKWANPWGIKTPKGYSTLFMQPAHNPNEWFTALEGLVDTDTYNAPVNFPFVLNDPKKEGIIPAGTPIVQIIPFKRDNWKSSISKDKTESDASLALLNSKFFDRYKTMFRSSKEYK